MKKIGEILRGEINIVRENMQTSLSKCPKCGREIRVIELNIFGQEKKIVPRCQCEMEEYERWKEAKAKEERKRKIEQLFGASYLGERFQGATFGNFRRRKGAEKALEETIAFAKEWRERGEEGLLLMGPYGNGKTHLVAAIYNHLRSEGVPAVFINAPELFGRFRASYDPSAQETEGNIIYALAQAPVLIFDDLGAERTNDWALERFYLIINGRYRDRRPTVYTTNLSLDELEKRVGGAIFDRIIGTCRIITNEATSFRQIQAAERKQGAGK